jgi:outer membrane protein OmpA-like peptidoglycan-associated protein
LKISSLKKIAAFAFIMLIGSGISAQEKFYRAGLRYFEKGLYLEALEQFKLDQYGEKNKDLLLKRMISNYEVNNLELAKSDVPSILAFEQIPEELYLYIAKIYHSELNFEKAVEYYKEYLRKTNRSDPYRKMVIGEIKRCAKGISLQYFDQKAFVENMGADINTIYEESDPIQSPNFLNKYYFSSNRSGAEGGLRNPEGLKDDTYGSYFMDMYTAVLNNGKWTEIESLNKLLNTSKHERVLDFNTDGTILFFLKGDSPTSASIHVDTFGVQTSEIYPPKFKSPLYGEKGDVYLQFYNDSTIIFSSKRKGGYGGYDLYVCYKKDKYWSQPKNLGPEINSTYDEITPFLTKDGTHLFFSSNGLNSIGGFDVFTSIFSIETEHWEKPENLRHGINSALDDTHFRISADGQSAYFSSNRKSSIGKTDLYIAYLKEQEVGQLSYNPTLPFIAKDNFVMDIASNNDINLNNNSSKATAKRAAEKNELKTEISEIKKKEFVIENLYFGKDENLLTIQNTRILDNIVDILKIYPTTTVEFESHSVPESQIAYELYFTIKRAEKLASYLAEKGIDEKRVALRGFGAGYPLVSTTTGQGSTLANKLNRRIEVIIKKTDDLPLKIEYTEPVVAEFLKNNASELYKTVQEGLSYRVKIAEVRQMYQNEVLSYYQDAMIEKNYGSQDYVYTIGIYKKYFDAQDVLNALKNDEITNAKIIPYLNGVRMPDNEIIDYAVQFPDLVNYLQYNGQ